METAVKEYRAELIQRYREAENASERAAVKRDMREFNRGKPQGDRIEWTTLLRNIESARERERMYRRYGANIDEKKAKYYERYGRGYE